MKTYHAFLAMAVISFVVFVSCTSRNSSPKDSAKKNILPTDWVASKFNESEFWISLPEDYKIDSIDGPDFMVYYFEPKDTLSENKAGAGIYLGNHPSLFRPDSCKKEVKESMLLESLQAWDVYDCDKYFVEALIKNKKGKEWQDYIHVFGKAETNEEVELLFHLFSSIKRE